VPRALRRWRAPEQANLHGGSRDFKNLAYFLYGLLIQNDEITLTSGLLLFFLRSMREQFLAMVLSHVLI
jgi:hypothetical protein